MPKQRKTARAVAEAGGTSICALKSTPKPLDTDVKRSLEDSDQAASLQVLPPNVAKGPGRIETRTASVCHDMDGVHQHDGPSRATMGAVTAPREIRGKPRRETRSFLRNTNQMSERLRRHKRSHWALENVLPWVLDVTMNEDDLRNRTGSGPEN